MATLFRITARWLCALVWMLPASLLFAPTLSNPWALASADFDGAGKADLVVGGTFQDAVKYEAGDSPAAIAVGDLNGDGCGDLIVLGDPSSDIADGRFA